MRVARLIAVATLSFAASCSASPHADDSPLDEEASGELASCPSITATNAQHVAAGRAYTKSVLFFIFRLTGYYAVGSEILLGTSGTASSTLYAIAPGVYSNNGNASCVSGADAGQVSDAGVDGGTGAGTDASTDAGVDASADASTSSCPNRLQFGANIHNGDSANPALVASVLAARNLTTVRMDLYAADSTYLAQFRAQVAALSAKHIGVEAILYDDYSRGSAQYANCAANLGTVEQHAYDQTLASAQKVVDIVTDFELQNEISLYDNIKKPNSTGQTADDYNVQCALFQAANLRGMSRALVDLRKSSGRPVRAILGTTDRSFGFLAFMQAQSVQFDVVGYHIYPANNHAPLDQDPWFGTGGPLTQLATFKRPIRINEFDCEEIYETGYENRAGTTVTETCLTSLSKHLLELTRQKVANVESVSFYELVDEVGKPAPENRFGLMYDLSTPKVQLYLSSAFAGGSLTTAERAEITHRGLLSDAQITAFQQCSAP